MIRIAIEIAEETDKLYHEGLDFRAALREAKEIFLGKPIKKATKDTGK